MPVFYVKGGDYRGNPRRVAPVIHKDPDLWVEDLAENQDRLAQLIKRG
jgi:hypothetical protein